MNFKFRVNEDYWIKLNLWYQKHITTYMVLHYLLNNSEKVRVYCHAESTECNSKFGENFSTLCHGKGHCWVFTQLLFCVLAKRWMRCKSMLLSFIVARQRSVDLFALSSYSRDENCDRIHVLERGLWALLQRRLFFKIDSTVEYETR